MVLIILFSAVVAGYQGVERLTRGGVKVGAVEPALLHALPDECESYAKRILERLSPLLGE